MSHFRVILHHVIHQLNYNKVDIRVQGHFTITMMYFDYFWYINKVYRPILKCSNLPIKHIRTAKKIERGVTKISFRECMVTIRDTSYIFHLILVTASILAYLSFFLNSPVKRLCPFNMSETSH